MNLFLFVWKFIMWFNAIAGKSGSGKSVFNSNACVELVTGEVGQVIPTLTRGSDRPFTVKINGDRRQISATDIKRIL